MYFLVKGRIRVYQYGGESNIIKDRRLVIADSSEEAETKYIKYWEEKSEDYATSYSIYDVHVMETIS